MQDDPSINCLCGIRIDDGFTIQCEKCLLWSHAKCYKIDAQSVPKLFYCLNCMQSLPTDTEDDVVDEESYINWGSRIVDEYKYGIHIGEKPPSGNYVPLSSAAFLIFPKRKLRKTPILSFMKFKAYDKNGNEMYLTLPGQSSRQQISNSTADLQNHVVLSKIKESPEDCFRSSDEINSNTLPYFAPSTLTFEESGINLKNENIFYRKACAGNLQVLKTDDIYELSTIDSVKNNEELIIQYSDLELDHLQNWTFQEFLSGCKQQPKSCVMITCASCKYNEYKHCILYHKLLRNTKLDIAPVRGDQPALSISPVETSVKRKRGRPPKKKPSADDISLPASVAVKKKQKQSPKLTAASSRKQSAVNSPIVAPKLNPASITPSQISEVEVDELIPQIQIFEAPISDLTYIQIGNGMVVKRARLKTVKKIPGDWKAPAIQSTSMSMRKMKILAKYRETLQATSPKKILKISDFIQ